MKHLSFTTKLILAFWFVLFLAFFLTALLLSRYVRQDVVDAATTRAVQALEFLDWGITRQNDFSSSQEFNDWITTAGSRITIRITYVRNGRVLADSQVPFAKLGQLDNHGTRPEIIQALREGHGTSQRFSKTLKTDLLYAAKRVYGTCGVPAGVLRVAIPLSEMQKKYADMMPHLLGLLAIAFCITSALGVFMSRRIGRSIRDFTRIARRIGNGEYHERLHLAPGKEFTPLAEAINTMAKQIETHIGTLEEKKGELEALFNGITAGVMILNQDGRIESWNHALESLYPDLGNCRGKIPLEATMQPEIQELAGTNRTNTTDNEKLEIQLRTHDHRTIHAVRMAFETPGRIRKIVIVLHDITELKHLERVRQDFMTNISHEIRTPVTCIKGYAETLLEQHNLPEETEKNFLLTILDNADHLSDMVERLLSLSKLDAQIETTLEPVALQDSLDEVLRTLMQRMDEKRIRLVNELPDEPVLVLATKTGLFEILVNLLDNAVQYGTEGMCIFVGAVRKNENVVLYVRDQGPGIPAAYRDRIFERFFRVENQRKGSKGHYGLGLAICRQIVTGFGGQIRLDYPSDNETGTVFYLTLRTVEAQQQTAVAQVQV